MADKGHSNPLAEELQNDENEYKQASDNTDAPMRNNAFLSDLNAHLRKWGETYYVKDLNFV